MAILAAFMQNKEQQERLDDFLDNKVFKDTEGQVIHPDAADVKGFELFMERYVEGLAIEQAAVDHLVENGRG
ncbi:hypothetical protein D3C76_1484810 [compost metagenome]